MGGVQFLVQIQPHPFISGTLFSGHLVYLHLQVHVFKS